PCGRGGGLSARGEQVGELGVTVQGPELIADAEAESPLGERGPGHAPGLFGDREGDWRGKGHGSLPGRRPMRSRMLIRPASYHNFKGGRDIKCATSVTVGSGPQWTSPPSAPARNERPSRDDATHRTEPSSETMVMG